LQKAMAVVGGLEMVTVEIKECTCRDTGAWHGANEPTSQRACRVSTSRIGRRAVRCENKATASCIGLRR
jgi:hypothetical protein